MVGQSVEQSARQTLGTEHARPLVERQITGDDRRASLITLAEDLEQQLGAGLRQGHVTEFVDDEQLMYGELALKTQKPLFISSLDQLVHQRGGGDKADRKAFLARCKAQPQGDVRLARAAVSERDNILASGDIFTAGELQHQGLVQRRQSEEVEAVEAFDS